MNTIPASDGSPPASPSSLARKLGMQPGVRICLQDPSVPAQQVIRQSLPPFITIDEILLPNVRYDQIVFWPRDLECLPEQFAMLQSCIQPNGAIWAVMPKKKFAVGRGIRFSWEQMQAAGLTTDLVDNKVASIGREDYGTRFVIRRERRPFYQIQTSMHEGRSS